MLKGRSLPFGLRDVESAQGLGFVSVTFEVEDGVEFLFPGSPDYVIDTRGFSAPVRGDPMHGQ